MRFRLFLAATVAAPLLLVAAGFAGGCRFALAHEEQTDVAAGDGAVVDSPTETPFEPATDRVAYILSIQGLADDTDLENLLRRGSELATLADRPPVSQAALLRRIEVDRERFNVMLRSEGYYAGSIESEIDPTTVPQTVVMRIDPGPRFTLKSFAIVPIGADGSETEATVDLPGISRLGVTIGGPARAADVVAAECRLLDDLADRAHPLARLGARDAIVDHADQSMRVTVAVDPGPPVGFGPVSIIGLDAVDEDYVRLLIPWTEGETYDRRKVEKLRLKLVRTALFSTVVITPSTALDADGRIPVTIELTEARPRSIGAGFKYYTSEGPAAEVFWEHRNLFGADEDLRISAELGRIQQDLSLDVLVPNYRRVDQDLVGRLTTLREETDAYNKKGIETSVQIRRVFADIWAVGAGPSFERAWIEENGRTDTSTLVGLRTFILRDTTDNQLNPTEGSKIRFAPTPYTGWYINRVSFMTNELTASTYVSLDRDHRYVVAGRTRIGSLFGESRGAVPADKRYYAGGGNSIRGYPYQLVGPLDSSKDPLGGRSLLEVSAEFRARVWGNLGVVPFIDGGTVYNSVVPDFSETMQWGAGLGLRYYTAIGPVRVDFAVPLNPRKDVDDPFQFYLSLGQAF